ncbi:glycerophosphodiester phosphodiesterase family protein [Aurantimicrobium minutum]|uniref:glycerophosphodiester phosphodiesterase family protein n=1 Tax=Aurantimicrobium minutum TaxID=708131 RepID=UPI00247340DE|nr:glycerophosphodiester phosphodiesterase family protein [Aurantimicrobium minutum]
MHPYFSGPVPHIFAHRGLAVDCKENTREAFAAALLAGATHLETDAHGTADGVAVLFHDDVLDSKEISSYTHAELPDYIPTLESVLNEFQSARFNIDVKNEAAIVPVSQVIKKLSSEDRILISSFSSSRRRKVVQNCPGVATSASTLQFAPAFIGALLGQQWMVNIVLKNCDAVQIPARALGRSTVTPRLVRAYHRAGVQVDVWTVNDAQQMVELVGAGVDGVVTDRADVARETFPK